MNSVKLIFLDFIWYKPIVDLIVSNPVSMAWIPMNIFSRWYTNRGATGGSCGARPPAFYTFAKDMHLYRGATQSILELRPCIFTSIINIPSPPSWNYPVAPLAQRANFLNGRTDGKLSEEVASRLNTLCPELKLSIGASAFLRGLQPICEPFSRFIT